MRRRFPRPRFLALVLVLSAFLLPAIARADEKSLIDGFNKAVGLLNDEEYDEARQALDAFARQAKQVNDGDPAFDRAQDLLKRLPDLYRLSYYNSSINAQNKAREAAGQGGLDQAAEHWQQAVDDLEQLARQYPDEKQHAERLEAARQSLSQARLLSALLAGKPVDDAAAEDAVGGEPEALFDSAPLFSLPLVDQPRLVSLSDYAERMLVVDLWQPDDPGLPLAIATLNALKSRYADKGLGVMAVVLDTDGLSKLTGELERAKAAFPVALDDLAEFREHYLAGSLRLPSHLVFTRDRRVVRISGDDRLQSTAALFQAVARELALPAGDLPRPASAYFPEATAASTVPVETAASPGLRFGEKPSILLVTNHNDQGRHLEALAKISGEFVSKGLNVVGAIHGENLAEAREFAARNEAYPVHWLRSSLPACYGGNQLRLVLISATGRVLKIMPIYSGAGQYEELLARYARILVDKTYPPEADQPGGANLAHRAHGGGLDAAAGKGEPARLNDGLTGGAAWESQGELPSEIVLSFLAGKPATFDRLLLDNQPPSGGSLLRDVEVLAADRTGSFQRLATFRCEARQGVQAFSLPKTTASKLKLRLLSRFEGETGGDPIGLGEVAVLEAPGVEDDLARRLARHFDATGIADDFSSAELAFWEQVEYFPAQSNSQWKVGGGRLEQTGAPPEWTYRASALLHPYTEWGDYRLHVTVEGSSTAAGLMVGFQDWDNFDRLVLLEGQNWQTGRPEGNSIRLETCRHGQLEVLALHGESFPLDQPIRLVVVRRGDHLAVQAEGKWIMHVESPPLATGRVGLFASNSHGYRFDDVRLEKLAPAAGVELPRINPLSTAAGASIVWLSSQGDDPSGWASNLLRTPVFSPPGVWKSTALKDQPPEVVFAFRGGREVVLDQIGFTLPAGAARTRAPGSIELLVSRDSALKGFRSVGTFDLAQAKAGTVQNFDLPHVACRYLMVRLPAEQPGAQFELAGVNARLSPQAADAPQPGDETESVAAGFDLPADTEQEPNDDAGQAQLLPNSQAVSATIESGQVDFFRVGDPPAAGGMLRLKIEAMPWLRLKATCLDADGKPLPPLLADSPAAQRAEQVRPASAAPRFIQVEMPAASLALVIDTSGSMGGRERDVHRAVEAFLQGVTKSETVEVIRFANDVERLVPFSNDSQKLVEAVQGKLRMDGATALYAALVEAAGDLAGRLAADARRSTAAGGLAGLSDSRAIVLLSDGMNTVPGTSFADVCLELKRRPVPLWVVAIGVDLHLYDAASGNTAHDLLRNLAEQTGGRFLLAPDSAVLADLYEQIAAEMRGNTRYRLEATWEALPTIDRSRELASVNRKPGRPRLAAPVPPAQSEIAPPGQVPKPGPRAAMPPSPPELAAAPGSRAKAVPRGFTPPPAWEPALPEISRGRASPGRLLPPATAELAYLAARMRPSLAAAEPPQFGQLAVRYQAPDGRRTLPAPLMPAVELILDSSHSMKDKMGQQTKLEVARDVVGDVLENLPDGVHLGLRLYGHRGVWVLRRTNPAAGPVPPDDPRLDTDSELVEPIGPLSAAKRDKLRRWLDWSRPLGNTPMVFSLLEARKDFADVSQESKTVILISDGKETSGGKLEDVERAYRGGEISMVIHVVGFDIQENEARRQLEALARLGGGSYFNAADAQQLGEALRGAVDSTGYAVYRPGESNVYAQGILNGPPLELESGTYRVVPPGTSGQSMTVQVRPARSHLLSLDDDGRLVLPPNN